MCRTYNNMYVRTHAQNTTHNKPFNFIYNIWSALNAEIKSLVLNLILTEMINSSKQSKMTKQLQHNWMSINTMQRFVNKLQQILLQHYMLQIVWQLLSQINTILTLISDNMCNYITKSQPTFEPVSFTTHLYINWLAKH